MKKLLLSSLMLATGIFAASAAEATIDFSQQGWSNEFEITATTPIGDSGISVAFAKGEGKSAPKYYTSGTAVRMYSGNTMTLAVPQGTTVTSIAMKLSSQTYNFADDNTGYSASTGTFTADPKTARTGAWTGTATEDLVLSLVNKQNAAKKWPQLRIVSMTVTYTAGVETKCATPKFSLAEGKYYNPLEITLTTSTADAKIMYSINGAAAAEYTAPIALSEVGTYAVKAYAVKTGLENSAEAVANYEIANPVEVGSIAEFIMAGEADATPAYKWTFPVVVTAQIKGEGFGATYVKDAAGDVMYIFGKDVPAYNTGDVIPAGVVGEYQNFNGVYEMTYPNGDTFAPASGNEGFTPAVVGAGTIKADDVNKVVVISGTYVETTDGTKTTKSMQDATGSVTVYYQSKWGVESATNGTKYDLLCAVGLYKSAVQVYPIKFLPEGGSVETVSTAAAVRALEGGIEVNAEGNVLVVNAAGQVVANQAVNGTATIALAKGFYIVRAADTVAKVIVK